MLLPYKVYAYLGEPEYIQLLESETQYALRASTSKTDFRVQGRSGGKKSIATLDCITFLKASSLWYQGFKTIYHVLLSDGIVIINKNAVPIERIPHKVVRRKAD